MLASWMLFTVVVTTLVAVAVRLWEELGLPGRGGLRWGWFAGAFMAPVLALLPTLVPGGWRETLHARGWPWGVGVPGRGGEDGVAAAASIGEATLLGEGATDLPLAWFETVPAWFAGLTPWLTALWAATTLGLLAGFLVRYTRLCRARRRWPRAVVAGREVLVSDEVGPGVLGLVRGETVLPRWCLALADADRDLVVAHEEEHRARRDPLLLAASRVLAILLPWNLPLWWMDLRLRVAVEMDCDARVAERWPDHRRRYAELLLATAARPARRRAAAPLALLVDPTTPLHRRIVMLTRSTPPVSRGRRLASGLGALVILAMALLLPGPDLRAMGGEAAPAPERVDGSAPDAGLLAEFRVVPADTPTFTPFTVAPEVRNRAAVGRALEAEYPSELREAGIGGTAVVFLFVSDEGAVEEVRLSESSGHAGMDAAALRVAEIFEFSPALNRDQRVPVWIQIPITFTTRTAATPTRLPAPEAETGDPEGPRFTPFTAAPEILNRAEVAEALQSAYPEVLREAGIGGTALLYFFIDEEGAVGDVRMHEASGHPEIDAAALQVARVFRFSPARNRDQAVPVWIQIPITFTAR